MRPLLALVLVISALALPTAYAEDAKDTSAEKTEVVKTEITEDSRIKKYEKELEKGKEYLIIKLKSGDVVIELFRKVAPKTVESMVKLTEKDFYDGLTWHRVVPNFVAQGGCPEGTGRGGPGYTLPAEFSDLKHEVGTVAMARMRDPNSAGSQFYIVTGKASHLDGQYTIFGKVIDGMPHVMKIQKGDKMFQIDYVDKRK